MPEEIELKLVLDPRDIPLLRKSPTLSRVGPGNATRNRVVTTYYDTSSLALLRNAVALRVRKTRHGHVQSIKIDSANGRYPAQRAEIENQIPTNQPDLRLVEDRSVRRLVERYRRGKRLKPIFSTNVMRETRPLKFAGNEIECAIDYGFVAGRGKKAPICELELKSGESSSLLQLARRLNANIPLRVEPASKAARGYALVNRARLTAPRAKPISLDSTMLARDCLNTIMHSCIGHVVASADYVFKSEDPEGIHQLRVAIRRTREAFTIIRRHVVMGPELRIADELRSLQQKMGGAREWDVLVEETLKRAPKRLLKEPFSAHLEQIVKAKRAEGHRQAHDALRDHHCTDVLLRLACWTDVGSGSVEGPSRQGKQIVDALTTPAAGFAAEVIQDCHRKARKLGKKVRILDSTELHRLRIRIKKLRYAAEFFGTLWPVRRTEKYLSILKNLQQSLGTYHDTTVATSLVATLDATRGKGGKLAVDRINRWLANEEQRKRKEVIALWSRFSKQKSFWKRAKASP